MPVHDFLLRKARQSFYNTSPLDFAKLLDDPNNIRKNTVAYLGAFSENVRDVFERYNFQNEIARLDAAGLLYKVVQKFTVTQVPTTGPVAESGRAAVLPEGSENLPWAHLPSLAQFFEVSMNPCPT